MYHFKSISVAEILDLLMVTQNAARSEADQHFKGMTTSSKHLADYTNK